MLGYHSYAEFKAGGLQGNFFQERTQFGCVLAMSREAKANCQDE